MKNILNLSLYLVLDPVLCGGIEGMLRTARLAVENGATVVQLRADRFKKKEWYDAAKALMECLAPARVPLIINNEVDVALAVNADGVHIGQTDLPPAVARELLGQGKIIGLSASNAHEVEAASREEVDYLGIGPVYPTASKTNAPPVLGLEGLERLARSKRQPAVAIGGIDRRNLGGVMNTGIEGIAVVSAICGQADPGAASKELARAIKKFQTRN